MKIVFMGSPDFAVPVLDALVAAGHDIVQAYTQPARIAGRGHKERKTPVHLAAERYGIKVVTPRSLRSDEERQRFSTLDCDVAVVAAYGLILPQYVLDAPRYGCFNLHASLLPRWRGAAPIHRAVMSGDKESGVCVMRMSAGLDEGPVCLCQRVAVSDETTTGDLHDLLAKTGAPLMVEALGKLARGALECVSQPDAGVTYAEKIDKTEAQIDFNRPSRDVLRHIHGLSPFPGAWLIVQPETGKPVRIKVLRCEQLAGDGAPGEVVDARMTIACAGGAIRPLELQREGKGPMKLDDFLRGFEVARGSIITKV